jgi:glycerol-3-phosphate dehydrogenase (NAD(P)+)
LGQLGSVAEGFTTAKAAHNLAQKVGVEMPISEQVYQVLYQKKPVKEALIDLINRDAKAEFTV